MGAGLALGQVWAYGCRNLHWGGIGAWSCGTRPGAGASRSLDLWESTWSLDLLGPARTLGPQEQVDAGVGWEHGAVEVTWCWCGPGSGIKPALTSLVFPQEEDVSFHSGLPQFG